MKLRITAEIVDENGATVVKQIEKEAEVPELAEFGEPGQFYETFDKYEQPVIRARNELLEEVTKEYLEGAVAQKSGKKEQNCEIESEIGRLKIENGDVLVPGHQPKERIYSLGFQEILLRVGTEVSYQKAVRMLNRLLHREGKAAIKGRTYQDYCQRKGKELAEYQERESEKVLKAAGFDSTTGQPPCAEEVSAALRESGHTEIGEATIRQAAETINAERISRNEQIQSSRQRLEATTETVYISVDEVGVKHQKEQRKQAVEKQGVYVWNTVAVVQSAGKCYTLSGNDTNEVFRNLLAYLLSNQLLESRNLVFLRMVRRISRDRLKRIFPSIPIPSFWIGII